MRTLQSFGRLLTSDCVWRYRCKLPPDDHVYGKVVGRDEEGAKEVIMTWKEHTKNAASKFVLRAASALRCVLQCTPPQACLGATSRLSTKTLCALEM
jgi:hypothetical protein